MIYTITLEDMEFKAFHGCYDLEKVVGNRFSVDITLHAELDAAAEADDVARTINYLQVYSVVSGQMKITSNILENLALRIADALYENFPQLVKVTVKVSKLAPPLGGKIKKVSVTLTK